MLVFDDFLSLFWSKIVIIAMRVIVKKLQGGECSLDVLPSTLVSEMKRDIARKLGIPPAEQKLLLLGRALVDEQTVESYPSLKDGTRLHLVVKKPDSVYEVSVKYFKKIGLSEKEAIRAANRLVKVVEEKFKKYSWDDLDRLAQDCLMNDIPMDCETVTMNGYGP